MLAVKLGDAEKWVPAFAGRTIKSVCRLFGLTLLALVLWAAALPAWAEDMAATVAGLGGASFADKEKAVIALGKSGDPRAVSILQALAGDRLRKAPDGRVAILATAGSGAKVTDAAIR